MAIRRDMRDAVFVAALSLIREGGPDAATVRAICARAGVTAPTLYHHFEDLHGLRRGVAETAFAECLAWTASGAIDDPLAEIERGWEAYMTFARTEPNLFAVMNQELGGAAPPDNARAALADLAAEFSRLAERRDLKVSPGAAAAMMWAAAHGAACLTAARTRGLPVDDRFAGALKQALFDAILQ